MHPIRHHRVGSATGVALTPDETQALLITARAHSERDYLLLLVTLQHGLRATEAISITAGDVRDGFLYVARLKKSQRTCHELIGEEKTLLTALASGKPAQERLFPLTRWSLWAIFKRHARHAGVNPCASPHSLKHTAVRMVLAKTGNLVTAKTFVGHSAISSTMKYTKPTERECAVQASAAFDKALAAHS